jgi:hypothetical protein
MEQCYTRYIIDRSRFGSISQGARPEGTNRASTLPFPWMNRRCGGVGSVIRG